LKELYGRFLSSMALIAFAAVPMMHAQAAPFSSSAVAPAAGDARPMQMSSVHLPALLPPAFIEHAPPSLDKANYKKDHWKNDDGTDKYVVEFGGGIAQPAGASKKLENLGWNVHLGAGSNFNHWVSLFVEYDLNNFGVPLHEVQTYFGSGYMPGTTGRVHLWSFTVDPMVRYYHSDQAEAYIIGGGGFYRKVVRFSLPSCTVSCGDHSSNNAGGLSIGTGITWKVSYLADARYFAEARYEWVDNQPYANTPASREPANQRTGYFPVTLGIRW